MKLRNLFGLACGMSLLATSAFAALPKASDLVEKMGLGYNIGNTMEVPATDGGPTGWGNPFPAADYVKAIKAAGFNTVRIPCAWDSHSSNGTINAGWLDSVKTVVDLVVNEGMYAILNSHWDGGWLEDHVFDGQGYDKSGLVNSVAADVAAKQENYWKQIATKFAAYDEHLIFASANEPGVNDPWNGGSDNGQWAFDEARMTVLKAFHEACLKAVRATGGNNATRTVVVQSPRTEIDKAPLLAAQYPVDPAGEGYTMAEVHFYPYQFSLMAGGDETYDWGTMYEFHYWEDKAPANDAAHTCSGDKLGSKKSIDELFSGLNQKFVSKGIPVVIGEMGAIKRLTLEGQNLRLHLESRAAWHGYTAAAAKKNGLIPCVWDTGDEGEGNFTIIRRQTNKYKGNVGDITDYETLNALRKAYGLDTLAGNSIDALVGSGSELGSDRALYVKYTTETADTAETGTLRFNLNGVNWSKYSGITFQIKLEGESAGPCTSTAVKPSGEAYCNEFGWASLDMFAMSGAKWDWVDYHLGTTEEIGDLQTVTVSFATDLKIKDLSAVNAIGFKLYGTQFTGGLYLDNIYLIGKDGTKTKFQDFNKKVASAAAEGIATITYVNHVASDSDKDFGSSAIKPTAVAASKMMVTVQPGSVNAVFTAAKSGMASAKLVNGLGQVIAAQNFSAHAGANSIQLSTGFRGTAMLIVKQGSQKFMQKVILK